jgi:THO complex subunit 2
MVLMVSESLQRTFVKTTPTTKQFIYLLFAADVSIPNVLANLLPKAGVESNSDSIANSAVEDISLALYNTFWSLDLYDLFVPIDRYTAEINRLVKEEERLLRLKGQKVAPSERHPFDSKALQEMRRVMSTISRLRSDQTAQSDHCKFVKSKKFDTQKGHFFPSCHTAESQNWMTARMNCFLTSCILPRCVCSPYDALFSFKFLMRLHSMNVPNFHIFTLFDLVFDSLKGRLMAISEEEAQNLAILVEEIWSVLVEWRFGGHYEKKVSKKVSIEASVS